MIRTVEQILQGRFDAVVFIDYPGFNLRLARKLRGPRATGGKADFLHQSPGMGPGKKGRIKIMAETAGPHDLHLSFREGALRKNQG